MKSNYEEKKAARLDRYKDLAAKNLKESDARYKAAKSIGDFIPMGQPILVGHHSEGRHRSDLNKIDTNMRKSIEADKKADYYEGKAEHIERDNTISSDDPNALEKLRAKLTDLEGAQQKMKFINACHAKYLKNPNCLAGFEITQAEINMIMNYTPGYSWEKHPYAPYMISNNNANISAVRKRIAKLEAMAVVGSKEVLYGGIKVVENVEENRVQIFFPDKPEEEVRKKLKSNGFRWSPSVGCWQAFYSNVSKWRAAEIAKGQ